jgi:transcriptional regulator with XRE-family HTH domain
MLSQTALSRKVGISRQQIVKFENGTAMPFSADLLALADYFAVSTDYLLGRKGYVTVRQGDDEVNTYLCLPEKLSDTDYKLLTEFANLLIQRKSGSV